MAIARKKTTKKASRKKTGRKKTTRRKSVRKSTRKSSKKRKKGSRKKATKKRVYHYPPRSERSARSHRRKTESDYRSTAKKPAASCSTVTGRIRAAERHQLPSWAFGLPELEAYPVYRLGRDGKIHPDAEQAVTAKAYAKKELDKGYLTREQYSRIIKKANHVLAKCSPVHRRRRRS